MDQHKFCIKISPLKKGVSIRYVIPPHPGPIELELVDDCIIITSPIPPVLIPEKVTARLIVEEEDNDREDS